MTLSPRTSKTKGSKLIWKPRSLMHMTFKPRTFEPKALKRKILYLRRYSWGPWSLEFNVEYVKPGTAKPRTLEPKTLKPKTFKPLTLKPRTLQLKALEPMILKPWRDFSTFEASTLEPKRIELRSLNLRISKRGALYPTTLKPNNLR